MTKAITSSFPNYYQTDLGCQELDIHAQIQKNFPGGEGEPTVI